MKKNNFRFSFSLLNIRTKNRRKDARYKDNEGIANNFYLIDGILEIVSEAWQELTGIIVVLH